MNSLNSSAPFTQLYIGGEWRNAADASTFPVHNPATGELLGRVASATIADADAALDAAEAAGLEWAARKPRERAEILRKAFDLLVARSEEFARLISLENGKALPDSRAEIMYAAEFFRWNAEEAVRIFADSSRAPSSGARILVGYRPAGISVLITPWNYPAAMGTRKIAPALAAGCSVIVKPASDTPLTMLALMTVLDQAGVPAGLVNVLPSRSSGELVAHLLADPRVRVVSFTGSTEVGRKILHAAADGIVTPAMELGGNAPLIVLEDADLDIAVTGALQAKMRNLGSACTAANRFYVHEAIHDAFVDAFAKKMAALNVGDPVAEGTDVGSLVNQETFEKVCHFVSDAVAKGAKVVTGGKRFGNKGFFYEPTVLVNVPDSADCLSDEIFGPVAAIQKFRNIEDVITLANQTEYGLIAYVFTSDLKKGLSISERLEFGMIGLNRGLASDPAAPFGGMKQSGIGREGAKDGVLEFLETQYISVEW